MPLDDDDLDAFYRAIEARTAAKAPRPGKRAATRRPPVVACPTPEKTAYSHRSAAITAIAARRHAQPRAPRLWAYECGCGRWHLTSKPPRD